MAQNRTNGGSTDPADARPDDGQLPVQPASDDGPTLNPQSPAPEQLSRAGDTSEKAAEALFGKAPRAGTENMLATAVPNENAPSQAELEAAAEERDKLLAVRRGAALDDVEDYGSNVLWLMDNLAHDRVALHERDPLHPGGEVFFAAGVPRRAFLTPRVQQMINSGELMPVPEPARTVTVWDDDTQQEVTIPNPAYPDQDLPDLGVSWVQQPGRPTPLGRTNIHSAYYSKDQVRAIRARQSGLPTYVPLAPGGTVPPEVQRENEEFMAAQRSAGRQPRR